MPSLESLNHVSEWVAHESRVKFRSSGWLCKVVGVESLFAKRKGALRVISSSFTGPHLALRSFPDMAVRTLRSTHLIEVKACDSSTDNVAIELWQYLWIRKLDELNVGVKYLFGKPDDRGCLRSWIINANELTPFAVHVPQRVVDQWPDEMKKTMRRELQSLRSSLGRLDIRTVTPRGSGDPYILVEKVTCLTKTVESWIHEEGSGHFSKQERIAWEGRDEASRPWKSINFRDWKNDAD